MTHNESPRYCVICGKTEDEHHYFRPVPERPGYIVESWFHGDGRLTFAYTKIDTENSKDEKQNTEV